MACQAPLTMEFPRQEYWKGFPFSSPGNLCDTGIEAVSPTWQADSLLLSPLANPDSLITSILFLIALHYFLEVVKTKQKKKKKRNKKAPKVWLRKSACSRGDPSLTVAESADQGWCPNWGKHPCVNFIPRQCLDFENGFSWGIPNSASLGKLHNPSEFWVSSPIK